MKTLILFGAGASYGSGHTYNRQTWQLAKTPLGDKLFDELQQKYPKTWGNVNHEIRSLLNENFESGMSRIMQNKDSPPSSISLLLDMAIHFSQFTIINNTQNLYCKLFRSSRKQLKNGQLRTATLNYECLIEEALGHITAKSPFWEIGHHQAPYLYKIHGSCNYLDLKNRVKLSDEVNFTGEGLPRLNMPIQHANPSEVEKILRENWLPPCFSIYMQGKPTYTGFNYVEKIQNDYLDFCSQTEKLICIGTKFLDHDEHVWAPIISNPAKLYYVGDRKSFDNLKSKKNECEYVAEKFEEAFFALTQLLK